MDKRESGREIAGQSVHAKRKSYHEKRETFLHPNCVIVSVYGRFLTYFYGSPFWPSFGESMREIT